ncbi:MAG TPA: right-handed parallel beta-helix repeat-containing protein, partial [Gammaproteobacteria bacterium]|nr:right-handed parallel beta-helix repeat-containing protein [Gammaproteobacteria bacterium]
TLELNADSKNIKLSEVLKEDDTYTLKISQAAQKRFCTLSQSSIKITNSDASVSVKCHNVLPAHPEASMWNQYFGAAPDPKAHGGELKKVSFQDSHSCDELHAQDALEAFDWTCSKDDATNEITFFSTGLKTDKGLTDLVQFGNSPAWKNNKLSVFNENNSIIYETSEGIWWTNPVMALSVGSTLASEGVVYLLQDGADLTKNLSIIANGVSLVIDPFVDFSPIGTAGVHISNGGNGGSIIATWVEGSIDATSSKSGIKVNNSTLAVLRNVAVKNAYANGIEIIDTKMTQIINSQSASNTGNGVSISTSKQSQIQNFISVNNKLSGVSLSSAEVKIHGLSSSNNNEDGVVITGSSNQLTDAIVSNNRQNGLVIAGAANNIINSVTIASNGEAGVLFKQTANKTVSARNNLLSNMTIANNGANSILFDTSEADTHVNNQFINILDAYNALAAECPASDCNVLKTLSTSDIPLNALFTPVSSDTNIARITSEDTLLRFGIVNQLATFQNKFRAWGDASSGTCNTGEITDCKLFDWRLNATNTDQALTQLGLTDIEPANTHTFLLAPEASSFLNNAIEIYGDGIGNDNSLCETDESCLFTPNIGSYQGHGEILPMEGAGNSLNATLFSYSENGA